MKCPLFVVTIALEPGVTDLAKLDCLKEGCEWYRLQSQQCVLPWLAGSISSLVGVLQDIRDRMPPEKAQPK